MQKSIHILLSTAVSKRRMIIQSLYGVLILSLLPSLLGAQQTSPESSCSNSYHLLEATLLSRPQNRYNLTTVFFPPVDAHPVIVQVNYKFENSNATSVWFWSESAFYFIQPLEIFLYTSLFFGNQPHRQGSITLELSADCLDAEDLHMKILTQRVIYVTYNHQLQPHRSLIKGICMNTI